jgi:hypothetical protein
VLEVVIPVSGSSVAGGDGTSRLIAWQPATDKVLWSVVPRLGTRTDSMAGFYNRIPVIADLNRDGGQEVLINYSTGVVIILKTAVKENENGADTRKHAGF